jgi:hypothetical protein
MSDQRRESAAPVEPYFDRTPRHAFVYTLRVKVPGNSHPWYKRRGQ